LGVAGEFETPAGPALLAAGTEAAEAGGISAGTTAEAGAASRAADPRIPGIGATGGAGAGDGTLAGIGKGAADSAASVPSE